MIFRGAVAEPLAIFFATVRLPDEIFLHFHADTIFFAHFLSHSRFLIDFFHWLDYVFFIFIAFQIEDFAIDSFSPRFH